MGQKIWSKVFVYFLGAFLNGVMAIFFKLMFSFTSRLAEVHSWPISELGWGKQVLDLQSCSAFFFFALRVLLDCWAIQSLQTELGKVT